MSRDSALKLAQTTVVQAPTLKAAPAPEPGTPGVSSAESASAQPKIAVVPPESTITNVETLPSQTEMSSDPAPDKGLSIVIKKEAQLRKERDAFKVEQTKFEATKTEYERVINRIKEFEDVAKRSKSEALKMLGWTDTDLINELNPEPQAPLSREDVERLADEKVKNLEKKQEEARKAETDRLSKEADDRNVSDFKRSISDKLKEDATKYKFASHEGREAELQAFHIIVENLKATTQYADDGSVIKLGEMMPVDEALQITNDLYREKYESGKKLFDESAHVDAQLSPSPASVDSPRGHQAGQPPTSNAQTAQGRSRTLNNAVTATSTSTPLTVHETREQKKERLANQIRTYGLRK